jgi:hypothetical protein
MGPVCARPLVLERPELGSVRHQCLAAFMGVVPFNRVRIVFLHRRGNTRLPQACLVRCPSRSAAVASMDTWAGVFGERPLRLQ